MKIGLNSLRYGDALPIYQQTQGSALMLSLEDEALDAVLEIDNEDIAKE